jgi:hypothetical protein
MEQVHLLKGNQSRREGGKHTKKPNTMNIFHISLRHNKAATTVLCRQLGMRMTDVALIQDPWIYCDQRSGLIISVGIILSVSPDDNIRSCIYVRNDNALPLLQLWSRDTANGEDDTYKWRVLWRTHRYLKIPFLWHRWTTADQETALYHRILLQQEKATHYLLGCKCTRHNAKEYCHQSQRRKPYGIS